MNDELRITVFIIGGIFAVTNVYLLTKQRVTEYIVFIWGLFISLGIVISIFPTILNHIAFFLGVSYPPALLFLIMILVLLTISMYQSAQITVLDQKVRDAGQRISILDEQLSQLQYGFAFSEIALSQREVQNHKDEYTP